MKKAAVYLRYSSERQTEQSIEGQMRVCESYAKNNDLLIVETYIDRALTGTNDNRADFQRMLRDADRKPGWDIVLVYALDRFGRNSIEIAVNKQRLKKNNILLISATQRTSENIDGSKNLDGILLENVYIGLAEYYSAELSQKVKRGMNESRLKKQFTGGHVLYGYKIVDKKYTLEQPEADIVRSIGEAYADGKTAIIITNELKAKGILKRNGKPFTLNDIYKIVQQEKYTGTYRFGDEIYEDMLPAIFSKELWEKLQMITNENKHSPSRRKSCDKYLLSGKLYCGECGGHYIGESGTGKSGNVYLYYKCGEKKRHTTHCTMPSVGKDMIENKVFDICCRVIRNNYIPHIVEESYKLRQEELKENATLQILETSLADKEKALNNLLKAIENGIFTKTTQQRMSELENDVETLRCKIECEKNKLASDLNKEELSDFLYEFTKEHKDDEQLKETLFNTLVRKVVLFRDKICITFNYSPDSDKGRKRDYDIDLAELTDIQNQYRDAAKCSTLSPLPSPNKLKANPFPLGDGFAFIVYFNYPY